MSGHHYPAERRDRTVFGLPTAEYETRRANQSAGITARWAAERAAREAAIEHGTTALMAGRCRRMSGKPCESCAEVERAENRRRAAAARPAWRQVQPRGRG